MSVAATVRLVAGLAIVAIALLGAREAGIAPTTGVAIAVASIVLALVVERVIARARIDRLAWGVVGGVGGLLAGTVLGHAVGSVVPSAAPLTVALGSVLGLSLGIAGGVRRGPDFTTLNARLFPREGAATAMKLVDTSAIIDGRIADLAATGFLEGPLVVPQFVLRELQQIADSTEPRKRARGKRGFEILQRLRQLPGPPVEITELDAQGVDEVDQKLLDIAKARAAKVITTDYNLNRLAEVNGVAVLNVNELANALKSSVAAGEAMRVHVVREGKEAGQGVGYLDDGTMVVVDQGKRWVGQSIDVVVTSVLQTPAGRILFTRLREQELARA